jgi:hypothetical protein
VDSIELVGAACVLPAVDRRQDTLRILPPPQPPGKKFPRLLLNELERTQVNAKTFQHWQAPFP